MSRHAMPPAWLRVSGGHPHLLMTGRSPVEGGERSEHGGVGPLHQPSAGPPPRSGEELGKLGFRFLIFADELGDVIASGLDLVDGAYALAGAPDVAPGFFRALPAGAIPGLH